MTAAAFLMTGTAMAANQSKPMKTTTKAKSTAVQVGAKSTSKSASKRSKTSRMKAKATPKPAPKRTKKPMPKPTKKPMPKPKPTKKP